MNNVYEFNFYQIDTGVLYQDSYYGYNGYTSPIPPYVPNRNYAVLNNLPPNFNFTGNEAVINVYKNDPTSNTPFVNINSSHLFYGITGDDQFSPTGWLSNITGDIDFSGNVPILDLHFYAGNERLIDYTRPSIYENGAFSTWSFSEHCNLIGNFNHQHLGRIYGGIKCSIDEIGNTINVNDDIKKSFIKTGIASYNARTTPRDLNCFSGMISTSYTYYEFNDVSSYGSDGSGMSWVFLSRPVANDWCTPFPTAIENQIHENFPRGPSSLSYFDFMCSIGIPKLVVADASGNDPAQQIYGATNENSNIKKSSSLSGPKLSVTGFDGQGLYFVYPTYTTATILCDIVFGTKGLIEGKYRDIKLDPFGNVHAISASYSSGIMDFSQRERKNIITGIDLLEPNITGAGGDMSMASSSSETGCGDIDSTDVLRVYEGSCEFLLTQTLSSLDVEGTVYLI